MTQTKRRRFGSVRSLGSGRWNARYSTYGQQHSKTFDTFEEAQAWLDEAKTAEDQNTFNKVQLRYQSPAAQRVVEYLNEQEANRGDWPNPRNGKPGSMPVPPFPDTKNPALLYLFDKADTDIANGDDPREVLIWTVVHAWMEGHIEGYHRGHREAAES